MKQWFAYFLCLAGLLMTAALAHAQPQPLHIPADPQALIVETASGDKSFTVEIADTDAKRSAGLMYRTDFPADRAMIFVFETVRPVVMWMANTPLPLDMLFVRRDGTVARIAEHTTPYSESMISSGEPVAFVIEINAGQAAESGIKAGDKVRHRIICGQCQ